MDFGLIRIEQRVDDTFPTSAQDGPILREALRRYVTLWLPLVKQAPADVELAPPVDVAWLWHVHRLSPLGYNADCVALQGRPLHAADETNPFAFSGDAAAGSPTRSLWETLYSEEPFENRLLASASSSTAIDSGPAAADGALAANLRVDILASVQRQSGFLWQARLPATLRLARRSRSTFPG